MKKRNGFTLIELVIVVAIIGILALMIIPQFNSVTKDAKLKTFQANCKTVTSAIAMYQAAHKGDYPTAEGDLTPYIKGGMDSVKDNPSGATYGFNFGGTNNFVFTANWPDGGSDPAASYTYPTAN